MQDFTTGVLKFAFSGFGSDQLAVGFGAADGSTFLLISTKGELALHSLADGARLVLSDRYTLGGASVLSGDGAQVGWSDMVGVNVYDWQAAASVMSQGQPLPLGDSGAIGFLPEGRLLVESVPSGGAGLDIWNFASGQIEATVPGVVDCRADAAGAYVLCSANSSGARRILALDNPDRIVFNSTDPNITVISPAGDSHATCVLGAASITYRNYAEGNATLSQPCQPMVYKPDGSALVLQSGIVIDLPSGESTLALVADANGQAFSSASPVVFFGPDFILMDNRAFDAATGDFLGQLPIRGALAYVLSEDGLTLHVLTAAAMEHWQALN